MKTQLTTSFAAIVLLIITAVSCDVEYPGTNEDLGFIKTGPVKEVSITTIPASGGSIKVNDPGTPVDGLEIVIPENSYTSDQNFKISYSKIISHDFGENFIPITPMITIACDGGYSNELMSVTVPVTIPDGQVALGFYLDESTGKLEGIPVEEVSANSITLVTRHFLSGNKLRNGGSSLKLGSTEPNKGANIIITSISESQLNSKPIIASGFKPGTDDWEFINYGSYIAPGGHCAGQSVTAMWYYFEKKPTEGNLFNKFSDHAKLWQDNSRGYRFCSVIQKDLSDDTFTTYVLRNYIRLNQNLDKYKYYSIAGTMLVTGEPCYLSIAYEKGKDDKGDPIYAGHAIVCYQIAPLEGKVYIADPNYPGTGQMIEYQAERFKPYMAKLNGNDDSKPYPFITVLAKTSLIEWNKIEARYSQLADSTIGNVAPNTFPPYTIWVKGASDSKLVNGFATVNDTLRLMVECPTTSMGYNIGGKWFIWYDLYDENGNRIDTSEGGGKGYTILKAGTNKIGVYIHSQRAGTTYSDGSQIPLFVDFKWFNVNYAPDISAGTFDYEGRTYKYKTIGTQTWMTENLAYLPAVSNKYTYSATEKHYYVYGYRDDSDTARVSEAKATANYSTYGVLYNWEAAKVACPSGWHLPTASEWTVFTDYLINNGFCYEGTGIDIGKSMASTSGWNQSDIPGTVGNDQQSNNRSGFNVLPGGDYAGYFEYLGRETSFWSATADGQSSSIYLGMNYQYDGPFQTISARNFAKYVRCVKN